MNVRIIRSEKNIGQGLARNHMFAISKCQYVHAHDADDLFSNNWCETIYKEINLNHKNPDLIISEYNKFNGQNIRVYAGGEFLRIGTEDSLLQFCMKENFVPSAVVYRREFFLKLGGYKPREAYPVSEDFELHLRMALENPVYKVICQPLTLQRWRKNSSCRDNNGEMRLETLILCVKALQEHADRIPENLKPLYQRKLIHLGKAYFIRGKIRDADQLFTQAAALGKLPFIYSFGPRMNKIASIFGYSAAFRLRYPWKLIPKKRLL